MSDPDAAEAWIAEADIPSEWKQNIQSNLPPAGRVSNANRRSKPVRRGGPQNRPGKPANIERDS